MKRWFSEPKPGVFVGTLNPRTQKAVLDYIYEQCPFQTRMLIISSDGTCQGYRVERMGLAENSGGQILNLAGIQLIVKHPGTSGSDPF